MVVFFCRTFGGGLAFWTSGHTVFVFWRTLYELSFLEKHDSDNVALLAINCYFSQKKSGHCLQPLIFKIVSVARCNNISPDLRFGLKDWRWNWQFEQKNWRYLEYSIWQHWKLSNSPELNIPHTNLFKIWLLKQINNV